ncbi:apolipoprotein N-acyltransferase [Roseofilum reptotaenium CS-1145]|uniref:Apolipoprotein N-acyltransferase n=1 Tax=Roseofilum reptotaenium AO1-A TaxID=1925591 RepID=A0A1L9QQ20_9CYAN|nr:apolipoprotein N-acyltransferase [Roseofilum reptotaenium]MDB9517484.1 apolipoprotein N-acyltransferase [Roseofilum reptotaenium CS-1145]OJJ24726.1 apolipoprotein N-acyltransferase [Roseofilum reptotaenium AO1-A]
MLQSKQHFGIRENLGSLALSLLGGLLMGITTAPINAWPLAWIALIPLWVSVRRSDSWKRTLSYALVWGIGFHGVALFWITGIHPMTWLGVPWLASLAIALSVWIFITLWGSTLVTLWAILFAHFTHEKSSAYTVLLGTTLWCLLEGIWSYSDLWWSSLSYTQSPFNVAILHLGQLSGPNTITAALVAVNGLVAEFIFSIIYHKNQKKSTLILALILLFSTHATGYFLSQKSLAIQPGETFKVGIIQGNIPNDIKLYSQGWQNALAGYTQGYQKLAAQGVDIVLTPETALPFLWTNQNRGYPPLIKAIQDWRTPVWVGAFGKNGDRLTNSLFTLDGTGEIISQYDKIKLVPLGEYIPFESLLGKLINRLSPLEATLVRGSRDQVVQTPVGQAIVGICYDSAFSQVFRQQAAQGGEFIITASNDAHYTAAMQWQHHAQDVLRAIESDRITIRATNTGYSAIVENDGKTRWVSNRNTYQIHTDIIERRNTTTLYIQWGDWIAPLLCFLTLGFTPIALFL